jgi:hypothetical protein
MERLEYYDGEFGWHWPPDDDVLTPRDPLGRCGAVL